mmetsp:Transcript_48500/g.136143  ORF Transcript_48500/g.136143 Transcript_48500/m.136143 type:complete len:329 (-) Transcript_48500:139-1125(-)
MGRTRAAGVVVDVRDVARAHGVGEDHELARTEQAERVGLGHEVAEVLVEDHDNENVDAPVDHGHERRVDGGLIVVREALRLDVDAERRAVVDEAVSVVLPIRVGHEQDADLVVAIVVEELGGAIAHGRIRRDSAHEVRVVVLVREAGRGRPVRDLRDLVDSGERGDRTGDGRARGAHDRVEVNVWVRVHARVLGDAVGGGVARVKQGTIEDDGAGGLVVICEIGDDVRVALVEVIDGHERDSGVGLPEGALEPRSALAEVGGHGHEEGELDVLVVAKPALTLRANADRRGGRAVAEDEARGVPARHRVPCALGLNREVTSRLVRDHVG